MHYSKVKCVTDYVDMLHSLSCKLVIDKPTRITKHSTTLIDHIYTNDVKSSIVSGIIIDDLSDHLPIFVISEKASPQKVYSKRKVRKINGINAEHFIADLQSRLTSKLKFGQLTSVNLQLELLYETFHTILEDHAPLINPSRKQKQLSKKPWMTANIHKLVRKKNKMFHKVYNKKQTYAYSVYKQFRNSLNRTIKIAKNSYYEQLINPNKNNSKKLWQSLGNLINLK